MNPLDIFLPVWNPLVNTIEWALSQLTEYTGSPGLAIIVFTLSVRTAFIPLALFQARSQRAQIRLQPQLKELQQKYGSDRQKLGQEQMRLYKEPGFNPAIGCLPLLVQMPIWFALYSSLRNLAGDPNSAFQAGFLWLPSLAKPDPLYILPVFTAMTQWVVQRMSMTPAADPQQQSMNRMMELMPVMFGFFALQYGAGLALYWTVSNLYSIVQQRLTVGWGTLPYLGTSQVAAAVSPSGGPGPNSADKNAGERGTPRARRNGSSAATRRRRGRL